MEWRDIRNLHPDRWLVLEALEAHSEGGHRVLDQLAIVEVCSDGATAHKRYRELHHAQHERELYFAHTQNVDLLIDERPWVGVRWNDEARPSR
ncbi:MAG: hypothetical protein ABI321_06095 [Polyangia bacterium]